VCFLLFWEFLNEFNDLPQSLLLAFFFFLLPNPEKNLKIKAIVHIILEIMSIVAAFFKIATLFFPRCWATGLV